MIKRLRIRFTIIAMASVIIILGVILCITNISTYKKAISGVDTVLNVLVENEGRFDPFPNKPPKGPISEETPFETRFFVVEYKNDGSVLIFVDQIAAIKKTEALEMANKVIELSNEKDIIDVYRYQIVENEKGRMVIFVDISRQLNMINVFFKASVTVALVILVGVFILVFLLSKPAVMPIVKNYEKQKQFITDASHELKTPLTIISANNELIEMEYGKNEYVEAINKQVTKLNSLVRNMILLSKVEEEDNKIIKQEFSLSECMLSVCENYKASFEKKNKYFICDIEENINMNGDESLIRRLINIIIDNANKYSFNKVEVILQKKNDIEIIINNNIDQNDNIELDKIFDRFYRSSTHRTGNIEGSGIGLAVASEIVKLHNGEMKAYKNQNDEFEIKINF